MGKISINKYTSPLFSVNIFPKDIDMIFSPDVGNNPSNPCIQRNQNK